MPTRFDHIAKEAGLIQTLPGRSEVMASKITVEFEGNLQGLIEFMEANFKDPNALTFKVSSVYTPSGGRFVTARDRLVKSVLGITGTSDSYTEAVDKALSDILGHIRAGNKVLAIKELRACTMCGLNPAKTAVETVLLDASKQEGT